MIIKEKKTQPKFVCSIFQNFLAFTEENICYKHIYKIYHQNFHNICQTLIAWNRMVGDIDVIHIFLYNL